MRFPKYRFRTKSLERKYKPILDEAVREYARTRPHEWSVLQNHIKVIMVTKPPRVKGQKPIAWVDDRKEGVAFLSEDELSKTPPDDVNPKQVVKVIAHEGTHTLTYGIPDTSKEESLATQMEEKASSRPVLIY